MNATNRRRATRLARAASWAAGLALAGMTIGCASVVEFEAGSKFDPALLEQSLQAGVSTQADVKKALGEPYGRGRALMPFHESGRAVWTYYYERGSVAVTSMEMKDRRVYLFMFFAEDRFDGYMWFASEMR
jgi:hypothetical protein